MSAMSRLCSVQMATGGMLRPSTIATTGTTNGRSTCQFLSCRILPRAALQTVAAVSQRGLVRPEINHTVGRVHLRAGTPCRRATRPTRIPTSELWIHEVPGRKPQFQTHHTSLPSGRPCARAPRPHPPALHDGVTMTAEHPHPHSQTRMMSLGHNQHRTGGGHVRPLRRTPPLNRTV